MRTKTAIYDIHRETKSLLQEVDTQLQELQTITEEEEQKSVYLAARLVKYLKVVDDVIRDEYAKPERDRKVLLDSVNIARRIIETKVKLDIDVTKLTLDQSVQKEFINIVNSVIDEEAPELKPKILSRLKSKFAISYAMGKEINE